MGVHDERDDEDNVDWDKYANVDSRASRGRPDHPLGDATRWGALVKQHVVPPTSQFSETIVRAQTLDMYARTWTALGTLMAPTAWWALDDAEWFSLLEVRMGVGQNSVVHLVNLRAVALLDAAVYQPQVFGAYTKRAWVMGGGILAVNLNIRVFNVVVADVPGDDVTTEVQIAPLAAGTGL